MYKRRLKNKHGNEKPGCQARHRKKSTSPKEAIAFLEVNEEATLSPGPSGPKDLHGAPTPTDDISCAK